MIKIADFGLARNVRDVEYYRKRTDVSCHKIGMFSINSYQNTICHRNNAKHSSEARP